MTLKVHGVKGRCYRLSPADVSLKRVPAAGASFVMGTWMVVFTMSRSQSAAFNRMARHDYHQLIAFVIDGQVREAAKVGATNFGHKAEIMGHFTKAYASYLARKIS